MDAVTQSLTANRVAPPSGAFDHWKGAPLRLRLSLPSGQDLTGAESIVAQLHADQKRTADALATVEHVLADFSGPWDLEFSAAAMDQTIVETSAKRSLWLIVVARYPSGYVDTLTSRSVTLHRTNFSDEESEDPPESASLTNHGSYATLTIGDVTVTLGTVNPEGAPAAVAGAAGGPLSITDNGGYVTLTVGGVTVHVGTVDIS